MANESEEMIVLYDEDGNEQTFEFLDTLEMDTGTYIALTPVYEDEEEDDESDDTEVLFMKVSRDEQNPEEEILLIVEDDDELDAVFEEFEDIDDEDE